MHIITIADKMDKPHDFYFKHNMHAVERKLNAMISQNKSLVENFDRNWRHPLIREFENCRV